MTWSRHIFRGGLFVSALAAWSSAPLLAAEVAPEISLSLRGIADEGVEQGEPIRVAVRLEAPPDTADAIELVPVSGVWSDAIVVELAPAAGGPAVARAQVVGTPATSRATLSATQVAGGLWRFPAGSSGQVAPGDYVVRARLVLRHGHGWTGDVVSDSMPIQVVATSGSADRVARSARNRAHDALLDGRIEEAATIIDAVLERAPDDEALLTVRAEIAQRAGNPHAAMACLNRFLRLRTEISPGQPSIELQELRTRIMSALLSDMAPAADPPAWSWPPASVLARPVDEIPASAGPGATQAATAPAPPMTPTAPRAASADPAAPLHSPAPTGDSSGVGTLVPSTELVDAELIADENGQWAASATASSEYGAPRYGAVQATGAPNIPLGLAGDSPEAWCPASQNDGTAWLEITFAHPVHATEVRVRQNNAPGAITRIEVVDLGGTTHLWWEGVDPFVAPRVREIAWFAVRVPRTEYLVAQVKVTLNLGAISGWNQIDAVQLVGTAP